ncbi:transcriptional regulator, AsnC family [Colwellia chukchiensis]|uniref:siroheme decarboxylase n=1 Tax=Colwellia chukchiensis TaxID=641665 RepID=A0A1H7M1B0_9GAMM|nr:AsnC family transcriptional regulator [Colwellia chukchiensis]SEL05016.1 transcriptional regulator, AsnC family [Colwellia chukchiensis]
MDKQSRQATTPVAELTALDKRIINLLQRGLPVVERPFLEIAQQLGCHEDEVLERLNHLMTNKVLTRFGPMFDAVCLGGAFTLAALAVPEPEFERVTEQVNSFDEVAHNYRRSHDFNMWFVVGAESAEQVNNVINDIESKTGLPVLNTPKLEEFYVQLYLPA